MAPGGASEPHLLETYETTARPLTPDDVAALHELAVSVAWPHRARDVAFLIEVGQGFVACDEIGRAVGSAMHFPMGDDYATIGLMTTTPRLQFWGAGRWLLRKVMERCTGRDLRLNATRQACRLYESAGFRPVRTIHLHQGIARKTAPTAGGSSAGAAAIRSRSPSTAPDAQGCPRSRA